MVPHWVRGEEHGEILPRPGVVGHPLAMTALGNSVGGDVTGDVLEATSLKEIADFGEKARGKIIFLNHTMGTKGGYGDWVGLRGKGPVEAAKVGAVGVVLRSLATASLRSPHTGVTLYDANVAKIPAAAISTEDAAQIHRMLQHGTVRIHFKLGCQMMPDAESFNVVADVKGRELPDEVVLLGAHLDSWDLADGANDDGAGVVTVMDVGRLIKQLSPAPRRTVRIVLFMNEENGSAGSKGYVAAHLAEFPHHVAALEADSGAGKPTAIVVHAGPGGADQLQPWLAPLSAFALHASDGDTGGADIGPLALSGVPFAGVSVDGPPTYFDIHHSPADTFDKIDPEALGKQIAAFAVTAYGLAEMPQPLPRPAPQPPRRHSPDQPKAL
jgi:hypothetical protein